MGQIDSEGSFRGKLLEGSLAFTKNGYPQFIGKFSALEKFIDVPSDMQHFGLSEPVWVDWSAYNEQITGYFVLFNSTEAFTEKTALLNYGQVQAALGWDGLSFDALNDGSFIDKPVLFRIESRTYNDKTSLQITWLDAVDAPPTRSLKPLDANDVKAANSKLQIKKKAAPAKAPSAALPARAATIQKAPPGRPPTEFDLPDATPVAKKAPPTTKKAAKADGPPLETTRDDAWEYIQSVKGTTSDDDLADAWSAAVNEVVPDSDDDDKITGLQWAKIRDIVVRDNSLVTA